MNWDSFNVIRIHLLILLPHRLLIIITVAVFLSFFLFFICLLCSHIFLSRHLAPRSNLSPQKMKWEIFQCCCCWVKKRIRSVFLNTSHFFLIIVIIGSRTVRGDGMFMASLHFILTHLPDQRDFSLSFTRYLLFLADGHFSKEMWPMKLINFMCVRGRMYLITTTASIKLI